jgi:hypothetical protein
MYSSSLIGKVFVSVEEGIHAAVQNTNKNDTDAVVFVDGSWWLGKVRDARSEFEAGPRIARAKFFDIDDIASKGKALNPKDLPHMAPPKVGFVTKFTLRQPLLLLVIDLYAVPCTIYAIYLSRQRNNYPSISHLFMTHAF